MWDETDEDPNLTRLLPFERDAFTYIEVKATPLVANMFDSPMGYVTRHGISLIMTKSEI